MKRYTIASYGTDFYTGRLATGSLALMGLLCPDLVVVYFDRQGNHCSSQSLALASPPPRNPLLQTYDIYTPEFQTSLKQELDQFWQRKGFSQQPIEIYPFQLADLPIGFTILPDHLAEFLEDPSVVEDEEEAASYSARIDQWEKSGDFVLWWGKDYWFGPDGKVMST